MRDPLPALRAYEENAETPASYEERTIDGLRAVLDVAKQSNSVPLIVAHRSTTGLLGKHFELWVRNPDYRYDSLLLEGGILAITDCGVLPLFRFVEKNWPEHMQCQS